MSKLSKREIEAELWRRGELKFICTPLQKEMYERFYSSDKNSTLVWLLARQSGKCGAEGTLVSTPKGPIEIQNLRPGDQVYGFNSNGTVSLTDVVAVEEQGKKEVIDLTSRGVVWGSFTPEHRWSAYNTSTKKNEILTTEEILSSRHKKFNKRFYNAPLGEVNEPHAYAIGALLGDGCRRLEGNGIWISSQDNLIPGKIEAILGCHLQKNGGSNYNWVLQSRYRPGKGNRSPRVNCAYFSSWIYGRYAHQKTVDIDIIKTWNRNTCLEYLAGLVDTEGSIYTTGRKKNELKFVISMQAKSVIDSIKYLFLALWQIDLNIQTDNRSKYKNGPCHVLYTNNNLLVKRFLKELSPHLVTPRKQYKEEYEHFDEYNCKENYIGLQDGGRRVVNTYDIQVSNDTNLYLLANGLVTHNSYLLSILALEQAIRQPNSIIKMITDTKVHVENIFVPKMNEVLETCPEEMKPAYNKMKFTYTFQNGSQIQLAGTDNKHYEKLRGQKSALVLIDEAGFCNDLSHVVRSIILPTTLHTGGKIVLSTTPPDEAGHEFFEFMEKAEMEGKLVKKTIYDNPLIKPEDIVRLAREVGGVNSPGWKREFLCEVAKDEETSVVPEFTSEVEGAVVKEWPLPAFYDSYVAMDLGFNDLTVALFLYYDFQNNKVIIQDEVVIDFAKSKNDIEALSTRICDTERKLWTNPLTDEMKPPVKRVSDINPIVIAEIYKYSKGKLAFTDADKFDKFAAINNLRSMVGSGQVIINPRCTTLVRHLRNARWANPNKKDHFARSKDDGHYDAVDALKYALRAVNYNRNPYPAHYQLNRNNSFYTNPNSNSHKTYDPAEAFRKIFGTKKAKKYGF